MNIEDITVEETCGGCPHTFHFYDENDNDIGGIRYRWGHFQCWPTVNEELFDNIIDAYGPEDRSIISYDKVSDILDYCKECIVAWHNNESKPSDAADYISGLLCDE